MSGLFNLGSIKHLALPNQWVAEEMVSGRRFGEFTQPYVLRADNDVKIDLYYRGKEVAPDIAADFMAVLAGAPHELDAREFVSIECVVRHLSEDSFFARNYARTENLNGQNVLVVEGLWKESNLKNLGVFINGNGSGSIIDELHFYASPEKYDEHLAAFRDILASIKFVQGVRR